MENHNNIFIISGGTGRTANKVINAAMTQFSDKNTNIVTFPDIREIKSISPILKDAIKYKALIIHTLVDDKIREYVIEECNKNDIPSVDLMGDIVSKMSNIFNEKSIQTPGLFNKLNKEYFKRIDAVQYTFKHDDGARIDDIESADIILLGVSRTFKTPLSVYLAYKGFFVTNIPIIDGMQPTLNLKNVDPSKVFCLTTNPIKLSELRNSRNIRLGGNVKNYSDYESCKNELRFAMRYYNLHPEWKKINVTDRPIEEIASEILEKL